MNYVFHLSCHRGIRKGREGPHNAYVCKRLLPLHSLLNVHDISDVEVGIKWRPDSSEFPELGPEFKEVWDSHFANAPDKPVLWTGILSRWVNRLTVHRGL